MFLRQSIQDFALQFTDHVHRLSGLNEYEYFHQFGGGKNSTETGRETSGLWFPNSNFPMLSKGDEHRQAICLAST